MDSKDSSYGMGHRERLRQKFLDGKATESEKLELLLTYAIPRCDVKPIARLLEKTHGNLSRILVAPIEDLTNTKGIKQNTAVLIKLIHDLMLTGYKYQLQDGPVFHNDSVLNEYCKFLLAGKQIEELHVFYLDGNMKLLKDDLHSVGTIDHAAVYPREIVKRALDLNARSVMLLHNHPIVPTSFSNEDISMTEDIKNLLQTMGIELYDHRVVSGDIVYSARNMFLIK